MRRTRFKCRNPRLFSVLCQSVAVKWSHLYSPPPLLLGFFPPLHLTSAVKGLTLSSMYVPSHTSKLTRGHQLGLDICMLALRYILRRVNAEKGSAQAWEAGSRLFGPELPGSWVPGIQSVVGFRGIHSLSPADFSPHGEEHCQRVSGEAACQASEALPLIVDSLPRPIHYSNLPRTAALLIPVSCSWSSSVALTLSC